MKKITFTDNCKLHGITDNKEIARLRGYKNRNNISDDKIIQLYLESLHNGTGLIKNRRGSIINSLGESIINSKGEKMTIIHINNAHDITIQFEDGTIKEHCSYANFKRGKIQNENNKFIYLGKKLKMNNGLYATLISQIGATHGIAKFEDGTEVQCDPRNFKKGTVAHPKYNTKKIINKEKVKYIIGEKLVTIYNETVEIIDADNFTHVKVKFVEANIIVDTTYANFKSKHMKSNKHYSLADTFKDKCNNADIDYVKSKAYRCLHPELTDEQIIVHYKPDLYINMFGELVGTNE